MELNDAILTRRSVRKFTDYYVTDEEINSILEAARWAPSWSNTQCWEIIVIRDRELIEKVTETYSDPNPAKKCSLAASALIAVAGKADLPGFKDGIARTKFDSWFMFDLGIAVQNMSLKAHDMGLGTVIVGSLDHDRCAELLDIKKPYELAVILPVGKPVEFKKDGPKRRDITDFKHMNKFGNK
jgi:nitroreductase